MSLRGENEGQPVVGRGKGRRRGAPLPVPKTRAGRGSAVGSIDRASSNSGNSGGRVLESADVAASTPDQVNSNGSSHPLLVDHSDVGLLEKDLATSPDNGMTLEELIEARDDGELTQEEFEVLKAGLEDDSGTPPMFNDEVVAPSDEQVMTFEELLDARDGGDLAQEDFELLAAGATLNQLRSAQRKGRLTAEEYEVKVAKTRLVVGSVTCTDSIMV